MDLIPLQGRRWPRRSFVLAVLVLAGCAALAVDVPIARFMRQQQIPGELDRLFRRAEFFGHTYGVIGIAVTLWLASPQRRRQVLRMLGGVATAGLSVDILKVTILRIRPFRFDLSRPVGDSFVGTIFHHNLAPMQPLTDSTYHSLPSGHVAVAVALAWSLGRMYPPARLWFLVMVALVAMNRLGGAHFASDVFWAAAVGYLAVTSFWAVMEARRSDRRESVGELDRTGPRVLPWWKAA